jgi:hypothetical protein
MDEHAVAGPKVLDPFSYLDDLAGELVSEYERRLFAYVPFHHVARADAAGPGPDDDLARSRPRDLLVLQADI